MLRKLAMEMIDPLSCLREYLIKKQPIIEKNNYIIFGEYSWPKSVKTNYRIFNKQQDAAKEYYTLECLLFFLKNLKLNHVAYVNFAKMNDVNFVRRPDRKKLLAYLTGEVSTSTSIDTSAPVVYPIKIKQEHQKERNYVRDSNFQSPTVSSSEASISRKKCQRSFNHNCIGAVVKQEYEDETDVSDSNFQSFSAVSSSEAGISRNNCPSSLNHNCIAVVVKQEHPKEITDVVRDSNFQIPSSKSSNEAGISRNKCHISFNHSCVGAVGIPKTEEQEKINTIQELSGLSSTELGLTVNEKPFLSLKGVKQVEEDYRKFNKKQRIENSCTFPSSQSSISRKEDQRYLNHDHNSSTEKQEAEKQDEIDIKPSAEKLLLLLSNRRISSDEEFSTLQKVKQKEGKEFENLRNEVQFFANKWTFSSKNDSDSIPMVSQVGSVDKKKLKDRTIEKLVQINSGVLAQLKESNRLKREMLELKRKRQTEMSFT